MADDSDAEMDDMDEMPGGEATVGDISVTDVWVRQPAEGQTASAAYGTITNNGDDDVTLVGGICVDRRRRSRSTRRSWATTGPCRCRSAKTDS
jgi:hypothetical protein